jgi:hypothetical protein
MTSRRTDLEVRTARTAMLLNKVVSEREQRKAMAADGVHRRVAQRRADIKATIAAARAFKDKRQG